MRLSITRVVIASLLLLGASCAGRTKPADIPDLVKKSARAEPGVTETERVVAQRIQQLGPEAIPYLLPLLKHEDRYVRKLTSYILRDMQGLREEHLDALMESRLKGDGWIPPAIARIGTPRAIAFLVDELKKEKRKHTQLTYAFEILGAKGVPSLVELIEQGPADDALQGTVVFIFGELKDKAKSAVGPLTEFISGKQGNETSIKYAALALGAIGPAARDSVPVLLQLAKDGPETVAKAANEALLTMGASEAVAGLLKRLDEEPSLVVCRDIASLKERGKAAGPTLVRYLRHDNPDARIGAARALGYIGYVEASPDLAQVAQTSDDWRLVYVSVESLGRLHAADAVDALRRVSKSHWYPAVRKAAKKAIRVIGGKASYESRWPQENFAFEFFDYIGAGLSADLATENDREVKHRSYVDQKDRLDPAQRKKLAYHVEIVSLGPGTEGRNMDRHVTSVQQVPDVGIKVDGGYLVGSDRGEWGGELVFLDAEGRQTRLLRENVHGIHRMTFGIVAVTGLSHGMTDEGILFKVRGGEDGAWQTERWKVLPGAPRDSGLLANGNLYVACEGGSVEVSPSGDIKMAEK